MIKLSASVSKNIDKMKQDTRNMYGLKHRILCLEKEYQSKCKGKETSSKCIELSKQIERTRKKLESINTSYEQKDPVFKSERHKGKQQESDSHRIRKKCKRYSEKKSHSKKKLKELEEKILLLRGEIETLTLEIKSLEIELIKAERKKKQISRDFKMETIKEESAENEEEELLEFIMNETILKDEEDEDKDKDKDKDEEDEYK